jgi:hypothetical protein
MCEFVGDVRFIKCILCKVEVGVVHFVARMPGRVCSVPDIRTYFQPQGTLKKAIAG